MKAVNLLQPPRIAIGVGCSVQCGVYLAQRAVNKVLLVSSTPVLPALGDLLTSLHESGIAVVEAPRIDQEPTLKRFEEVLTAARHESVQAVLGVGGGSAIDVAKLVAALMSGDQTVREVFGINLLKQRRLPLVCMPTTSGTGAEVSPNAILLDEADKLKKGPATSTLLKVRARLEPHRELVSVQLFSALKHTGHDQLLAVLNAWLTASSALEEEQVAAD